MKKNITKELIVETALELMRDKSDFKGLNMREIARALNCAHTNIYNYFPTYSDLLWATHTALLEMFMGMLTERILNAESAELKLVKFFDTFSDIYLNNKGWFRLAWTECMGGSRPEYDRTATENTFAVLTQHLSVIWRELHGNIPDKKLAEQVLHNTHCYIIGEVSNHISSRGIFENETELREYIVKQSVNMLKLCLR